MVQLPNGLIGSIDFVLKKIACDLVVTSYGELTGNISASLKLERRYGLMMIRGSYLTCLLVFFYGSLQFPLGISFK